MQKSKNLKFNLRKVLYGEWLIPIVDYYKTLNLREFCYEWISPLFFAALVSFSYIFWGDAEISLSKLREVLPDTLAILIGFTITCVTVLVASGSDTIELLKKTKTKDKRISDNLITLYQWLLVIFIYVLIAQISLLIFIFFSSYVLTIYNTRLVVFGSMFTMTFLLLHVLLILIRNITNFYFIFFREIQGPLDTTLNKVNGDANKTTKVKLYLASKKCMKWQLKMLLARCISPPYLVIH